MGLLCEQMGMPRMFGRVLGWLLICDPPEQSSSDLVRALGVSKGSVSTSTRMLESAGLIQRLAVPGERGHFFRVKPLAFADATESDRFRAGLESTPKQAG